jgi:hypothetical protein
VNSVVGDANFDGSVSVRSVARLQAEGQPQGRSTNLVAELIDEERGTLAQAAVVRTDTHSGCCCGGGDKDSDPMRRPFRFKAYLRDVAPGTALHIRNEDETVWERRPAGEPPRFTDAAAEIGSQELLLLRWRVESSADDIDVWAQWSKDEGRSWHGLAIGLQDGSAELSRTGCRQDRSGFGCRRTTGSIRRPPSPSGWRSRVGSPVIVIS